MGHRIIDRFPNAFSVTPDIKKNLLKEVNHQVKNITELIDK